MPRRIPIRAKLAAALAVPICALLLVSALEVAQSISHTNETETQTELATASIGPGGLIAGLQNERNYGSLYILGFEGAVQLPVSSMDEAAAATDDAIAAFRAEVESKGGDVAATYAPAIEAITSDIDALRELAIGMEGPRNQDRTDVSDPFFNGYTELIDTLFQANGQVALAIDDPTLRRGVELTDLASHQIENLARTQRVVLLAGVGDGLRDPEEIAEAAGLVGQIESNLDQTRDLGVGRYGPATGIALDEFEQSGYLPLVETAIETGEVQLTETLGALSREEDEGFNGYRIAVNDQITDRAQELNDAASSSQWRYVGLAALAMAVAALVTWLVSRSITKPLRSLTRQAKDMAEQRLPEAVTDILDTPLGEDVTVPTVEPVRVNTRDEVSDVADALNTVQDSALDLAVEQAVLRRNIADSFVNLGRRNQNLLGRQLDFITELETNETDADTLANLFRLDHLATRMRRNAESLLVLAGIEPPRQWAAPVRLTDVIRAALGEVEDYQRVTVRGVEPATILGSAAADLAHLLAELIENALVFSPPDQSVDIRGRNRPDGYTLAIIDSGLGMPPNDIASANRRLAGAESFTIAPSKYLGHYVAGNLAARHDILVHLENSPGNGVTATVDIPPTLLTTDTAVAAPVTPPHGTRAIAAPAPEPLATVPVDPTWTSATPDWLVPGPASVAPAGTGGYPPAPPPEVRRTESGLTKRNVRQNTAPAGGEGPSADLLDALSRHTARLHGGAPQSAPTAAPAPSRGWDAPSGPPASTSPSRPAGRSWPRPPEPALPETRTYPEPRTQPGPASQPEPLPLPDPSSLPGPPQPFTPTWTPSPAPDGWEPSRGTHQASGATGPAATPSLPSRQQPGPAAPADGDTTTGGLARRVRGAQLPTTEPVRMRRPAEPNGGRPAAAAGPAARTAPARTPEQRRQADDVYNFLSNFTAGVRRGLDESSHEQPGPDSPDSADPRWR